MNAEQQPFLMPFRRAPVLSLLWVLVACGGDSISGPPPPPPAELPQPSHEMWIGAAELARLPMQGPAWEAVKFEADGGCGDPDLSDQDQRNNVCIMAKALVYARTGEEGYQEDVIAALEEIVSSGAYRGTSLALGRELAAYVISADLVNLRKDDAALDDEFRAKIAELLVAPTVDGTENLIDCNERRPNNWGTHCGATRAAIAVYLGDQQELDRVATVFRGYLGDRTAYAGFTYGALDWQCDREAPVGVNPAGCTKNGHSIDGVLPDDQRRAGRFRWPPPKENYTYGGLQGGLAQAVILHRAGYPAFEWEDRALFRALRWTHEEANFPAQGDDTWEPHLVNHYYDSDFPAPVPSNAGKNVGWTDWTHSAR